ncbi:synaptic plasticity regulator PANTS isoform X1 [Petaurus breviceps papuanus]|uniref:synaptic plasticity regulator PANTS isoform X1 n=1 Tax=Petaurus breviceps papuanus TaxID=3040969 RepID=UPI0036DFA0A9
MSIPPTSGLTPSIGCYPEEAGRVRSCKMADAEENFWRPPRSCEDYWAEWKHCRTLRNLLHHYYTYGETPACAQWKRDYRHCRQWEESGSAEAKPQGLGEGPHLCPAALEEELGKQMQGLPSSLLGRRGEGAPGAAENNRPVPIPGPLLGLQSLS